MAEPAVDASPLIFLARAGLLELLQLEAQRIVVPAPVASELLRRGPSDSAAAALATTPWLEVRQPPAACREIEACNLGPGESSVLAWCTATTAVAILDDLNARRCAARLGIPVRGTLGLVLLAKERKRVALARPLLEALRQSGMYLSQKTLDAALLRVGE